MPMCSSLTFFRNELSLCLCENLSDIMILMDASETFFAHSILSTPFPFWYEAIFKFDDWPLYLAFMHTKKISTRHLHLLQLHHSLSHTHALSLSLSRSVTRTFIHLKLSPSFIQDFSSNFIILPPALKSDDLNDSLLCIHTAAKNAYPKKFFSQIWELN